MLKRKNISWIFLLALATQACVKLQVMSPAQLTPQTLDSVTQAVSTPMQKPTATPRPTQTLELPTPTIALAEVTITAVKGNLNIRRGPGLAYNSIGVLYEGTSATIIAHDVLTKWAQIQIPNSTKTGWVSVLTKYSQITGDLEALPGFTTKEWPITAYLRNCTHHQMYIMPGEIILPSSYAIPENEIWLNPGHYFVYDFDLPNLPEVKEFEIREGQEVEIVEDGSGERRLCPKG
ncbi:MAG: SH3 domain-containing protein [Anaerolineales bacterium]|nr:SH3 domain-containing protein [Anaerolineales bacterium]MCZ2122145.1 SH3 domain-containing protein [Anaerolineales bacterium]